MNQVERYLALLKKSLLNELYVENEARIVFLALHLIARQGAEIEHIKSWFLRIRDWPIMSLVKEAKLEGGRVVLNKENDSGDMVPLTELDPFLFLAHTMIGRKRLDNLHQCLDMIVRDKVPGDVIETGVWKGGATIFMRGYFAAHGIEDRTVWVADSFEGLPKPTHEKDWAFDLSRDMRPDLAIDIEDVEDLFRRYDLLDDRVRFLKGWFSETLPNAPVEKLAILRLDGDLYESTMDALWNLYSKVSPGGFVIVDDYLALPQCKEAVDEFRAANGITEELIPIDTVSVFWRKMAPAMTAGARFSSRTDKIANGAELYSVTGLIKRLFSSK